MFSNFIFKLTYGDRIPSVIEAFKHFKLSDHPLWKLHLQQQHQAGQELYFDVHGSAYSFDELDYINLVAVS